jgi:hypothetical protein
MIAAAESIAYRRAFYWTFASGSARCICAAARLGRTGYDGTHGRAERQKCFEVLRHGHSARVGSVGFAKARIRDFGRPQHGSPISGNSACSLEDRSMRDRATNGLKV